MGWLTVFAFFEPYDTVTTLSSLLSSAVFTPISVLWILEINTVAFSLVIKSFDFWMKMCYLLIVNVFGSIRQSQVYEGYNVWVNIFGTIPMLIVVVALSSFDALNIRSRAKIVLSCIMAI